MRRKRNYNLRSKRLSYTRARRQGWRHSRSLHGGEKAETKPRKQLGLDSYAGNSGVSETRHEWRHRIPKLLFFYLLEMPCGGGYIGSVLGKPLKFVLLRLFCVFVFCYCCFFCVVLVVVFFFLFFSPFLACIK